MPDDGSQRNTIESGPRAIGGDAPPRRIGPAVRKLVLLAVVLVAVVGAGRWAYWQWSHISETDARVVADMIVVSSRVAGWVVERPVEESDAIAAGAVLVAIDARDALLQVEEIEARIAGFAAERERLAAERTMREGTALSRLQAARSRAEAARVAVSSSREQRDIAGTDYDRVNSLGSGGVVSQQRIDSTRSAFSRAAERFLTAQADLDEARADVAEAEAALGELLILDRRAEILRLQESETIAQRDRLMLDVADRTVRSGIDGVVSQVFVDVGEYVSEGQRLLLIHDPRAVRIEANIKETELRHIAPGMPVAVHIDAYPGRIFDGRIDRIGVAATSEFALLPNPNPSGNFTKVTQRMPVRIAVTQENGMLRPGMMAVVDIEIPGR